MGNLPKQTSGRCQNVSHQKAPSSVGIGEGRLRVRTGLSGGREGAVAQASPALSRASDCTSAAVATRAGHDKAPPVLELVLMLLSVSVVGALAEGLVPATVSTATEAAAAVTAVVPYMSLPVPLPEALAVGLPSPTNAEVAEAAGAEGAVAAGAEGEVARAVW